MPWRIFYQPGSDRPDDAARALTPLTSEMAETEDEARALVRRFLDQGFKGVSVRRPGRIKVLKGQEMREWAKADETVHSPAS